MPKIEKGTKLVQAIAKGPDKTPSKQASKLSKEKPMMKGVDKGREKSHNDMCKSGFIK